MTTKRDVLQVFTKSKLIEISSNLGYRGLSVLTKDEIVSKLSRLRSISVEDILRLFKINELRFICTKLSLNPGGLSKQTLVDRIVGNRYFQVQPSGGHEKSPSNEHIGARF